MTRPKPSVDLKIKEISEIPNGRYRVRIAGIIVSTDAMGMIISDGSDIIRVEYGNCSIQDIATKVSGRFIIEVEKDDRISARLIAWHSVERDDLKRYQKLVLLERRM